MNPYVLDSLFIGGAAMVLFGIVSVLFSGLLPQPDEEAAIQYGFAAMLTGGTVMAFCGILL